MLQKRYNRRENTSSKALALLDAMQFTAIDQTPHARSAAAEPTKEGRLSSLSLKMQAGYVCMSAVCNAWIGM